MKKKIVCGAWGQVVKVLDQRSKGLGFDSRIASRVPSLGNPHCPHSSDGYLVHIFSISVLAKILKYYPIQQYYVISK